MTICIAGLAESKKGAILSSDKMITKKLVPTEFEHPVDKIKKITDDFYVLIAGTINYAEEIIERGQSKVETEDSYDEKINNFKDAYSEIRNEKIIDEILKPQGLESLNDFHKKQSNLHPSTVQSIQEQVVGADLQATLILVGNKANKFQLSVLANPGKIIRQTDHVAVGTGNVHADQSLIGSGYNSGRDLRAAAYLILEAKKRSEVAPGVGDKTELLTLKLDENGNITKNELSEESLQKLDAVYDSMNKRDEGEVLSELEERSFDIG